MNGLPRFAPAVYAAGKLAWRMLIEEMNGTEAAVSYLGISRSLISDYGNPDSDRFPPLHIILNAEKIAGKPLVTRVLADAQGWRLERREGAADVAPSEAVARVLGGAGKVGEGWTLAMADGRLSDEERRDLRRRLMAQAADALAAANALEAEP